MKPSSPEQLKVPQLHLQNLGKSFGRFRAIEGVSLTVRPGTFHAIVGENGAGKSTLAKCILGMYTPDTGSVTADATPINRPVEARAAGIGMVFQQFNLVPSMTVAENLLLARPDLPAVLRRRDQLAALSRWMDSAPFTLPLETRVEFLAAGQKQKLEILKQLYLGTRVLLLDEPTSVLTTAEATEVMQVLSSMVKADSLTVVLISHKFREVMEFATNVTVLRRGRHVATLPVAQTTPAHLAQLMMGESHAQAPVDRAPQPATLAPALELEDLVVAGDTGLRAVDRVTLTVSPGEILGVAGISGNGQRELVQAIAGQRSLQSGSIRALGKPFHPTRAQIRSRGLFTLPEDPLVSASVPSLSVAQNLAVRTFDCPPISRWLFFINPGRIRAQATVLIRDFFIRLSSPDIPIRALSGGNLRKAVVGRDVADPDARILVIANPTMGLDFLATAFLHNRMIEFRNRGGALLLVSEDLDELMLIADRIVVMSSGTIAHETRPSDLNRKTIGSYFGGTADD